MTSKMKRRVMVLAYVAVLVMLALAGMTYADAATGEVMVSVPIDNIVRGDPGETLPARDPVSTASLGIRVGQVCDVELIGENPGSEHPVDGDGAGNDLILTTNGQTLVAPNFEATRGKITAVSAMMTMGEFVTFDVLLGEDGVSSGGLTATFDCSPPNQVPDFCEEGIKFDDLSGLTFTVPEPPAGTTWVLLVLKAGQDSQEIANPVVGQAYAHENGKEISHAIICYVDVPPTTTTTLSPTTTLPPTTTTTMENWPTTTTLPPTTTSTTHVDTPSTITVPESTTSSTIETPEGGVPAGGGSCADGACCICVIAAVDLTWAAWALIAIGLLLAVLSSLTLWRVWRR